MNRLHHRTSKGDERSRARATGARREANQDWDSGLRTGRACSADTKGCEKDVGRSGLGNPAGAADSHSATATMAAVHLYAKRFSSRKNSSEARRATYDPVRRVRGLITPDHCGPNFLKNISQGSATAAASDCRLRSFRRRSSLQYGETESCEKKSEAKSRKYDVQDLDQTVYLNG